jgi:hypothetical protein
MPSKWLDWKPEHVIEKTAEHEPSKPSKPGSVGFVGSLPGDFPIIRPDMPPGVRLVAWSPKEPPVVIETSAVVVNPALFAQTTLEQLTTALASPERWIGWSVPQLIDRLAQVGVFVKLGKEEEGVDLARS